MTDIQLEPHCLKCGSALLIDVAGGEPTWEDRVSCPVHGFLGTRAELDRVILQDSHEAIGKHVGDEFEKSIRAMGFDIQKE